MPSDPFMPPPRGQGGPPPQRPDAVALVWIGGALLAALAYAVGPEHFLATVLAAVSHAGWYLEQWARNLTATAFDVLRAAAIGLYGTFAALSVIAISRGGRGRFALIVVTAVFLLLVWGAWGDAPAINTRWLAALVLTAAAALSATRRLTMPGMPR